MGELEADRVRRWLDATVRFRITHNVYVLNPRTNDPMTAVRVPQLRANSFERFDLRGDILDEQGVAGNTLYVECKSYSNAGNQGVLYDEYLAVCYSAFGKTWDLLQAVPSMEFM